MFAAMVKLTLLYGTPKDAEAFNRHYEETHVPLAAKLPGLRRYEWGATMPGPDGQPADRHLVVDLYFDDLAAMGAALQSPEGKAANADLANFADGGVIVYTSEVTNAV